MNMLLKFENIRPLRLHCNVFAFQFGVLILTIYLAIH